MIITCRKLFCFGLFFVFSQFQVWAAEIEGRLNASGTCTFLLEFSNNFHTRYGNLLTLSFQNQTGHSLNEYRILALQLIDTNEPYVPGNVVEHMWNFVGDADEIAIPLSNLAFTLAVYKGQFDGTISDRDVIEHKETKQVFMWDAEGIDLNVKSMRLVVH